MTSAATSIRPLFNPVDTSFDPSAHAQGSDDVESPSLSSSNALARFEFEPGRSKEGTKVLMVEWEDDDVTKHISGDWEICWEGKRTVLPAREQASSAAATTAEEVEVPVNRLYFLLGPGVPIPTTVKLQKSGVTWRTNPLPAIFSPDLGATARQAGKKGVLHTIWAKKRLQVLQGEIDAESKTNAESIGLEMAVAEMEWIEQNFGVLSRPPALGLSTSNITSSINGSGGPSSPRSPGGGRLMDKLRGLKISTGDGDLSPGVGSGRGGSSSSNNNNNNTGGAGPTYNPLSPETSDVAIGSFGSFAALKGMPPTSTLAAKPPQQPPPPSSSSEQPQQQQPRRIAAQRPPDTFGARSSEMGSLNALAAGGGSGTGVPRQKEEGDAGEEDEDDLFALPMSPRSPEMAKSPFSFAPQDTGKYAKEPERTRS